MSSLISAIMAGGPIVIGGALLVLLIVAYALFCAGIRAIRGKLDI